MQDTHATPLHSGMDGWQRDLMIRMTQESWTLLSIHLRHPYDHMVRARKSEKPSQPRSFIFTSKQGALPFPITSPPPFRHLIFFDWVWLLWTEHLFCRLFVRRWRSSVPNSSCLNRERRAKYLTPFVLRSFVGFRSWANRMFCHVSQSQDILQRNGSINASLARLRNLQFLPAPGRVSQPQKGSHLIQKRSNMSGFLQDFQPKLVKPRGPPPPPGDIQSSLEIHLTLRSGGNRLAGDLLSKPGMRSAPSNRATNSVKESSFGTKTSAKCGLIYSNVYIYMYTYIVCTYYQI